MNHFICSLLNLFLLFHPLPSASPVRLAFLSNLHLPRPFASNLHMPRPFVSNMEGSRPPNDVLEICWGDRRLTISPRALPTLIDYFRVCTNAIYVLSPEEEPQMLSTLRNKIYNTLPDVNKAYLYSAITYDQVSGLETALHNVEKIMAEKNIPPSDPDRTSRWLTINTNSSSLTAPLADLSLATNSSDNPCKDLVVLDGVDKATNSSLKFIPTPYQDAPHSPQYMAVPFSQHFLYDIHARDSADVLRNYYRLSVRCLATFAERDVRRFKESLYNVIVGKILPVVRRDPYRIVPAYGGVLEILADVSAYMSNASETQSASDQQGLANIHFRKPTRPAKRAKAADISGGELVWSDNGDADVSFYYQSLLLLLAAVCLLNCLCYCTTFLFYFVIQRKHAKQSSCGRSTGSRSQQGVAGSRCSVWSRPKDMEEEQCCHVTHEEAPFTSCLVQKENDENQSMIQHIKCPHNVISPRPKVQPKANPTGGQKKKYYRVVDFSLFKPRGQARQADSPRPLLTCDLPHGSREDEEAAQSIQGSEEFQRIMRELDEVHRNIQTVFPRIHGVMQEGNAKLNNDRASTGRGATNYLRGQRTTRLPMCAPARPSSS